MGAIWGWLWGLQYTVYHISLFLCFHTWQINIVVTLKERHQIYSKIWASLFSVSGTLWLHQCNMYCTVFTMTYIVLGNMLLIGLKIKKVIWMLQSMIISSSSVVATCSHSQLVNTGAWSAAFSVRYWHKRHTLMSVWNAPGIAAAWWLYDDVL